MNLDKTDFGAASRRPATPPLGDGTPRDDGSHSRRWIWIAAACLLVAGALVWFERGRSAKPAPIVPVVPVAAAAAKTGNLDLYLSQIGTVTPFATVTIKTRVAGQILKLGFKEGEMVSPGQLLFEIDPRPYQAQLDQYRGQLARDEATLANARITLERYKVLLRRGVIARQELDNQQAAYDEAIGAVQNDQGLIEGVKVNLGYCSVTSPIKGRIGLRQVDLGNYVQATDTLAVVTQLQPISVIFSVAEDNIPAIARVMATDRRIPVQAWNRDFSHQLADGFLLTFDNTVDQSTGTVKLRAQFANDNYALFPDQFVNARLLLNTITDTTLVPTAAVQQTKQGAYLYVVQSNQTVARREVTVAASEGDSTAISAGVSAGELVVTDGLDKLQPGSRVNARIETSTPAASPAPL